MNTWILLSALSVSLLGCKTFRTQPDFPNIAVGPWVYQLPLENSYFYLKLIDGPSDWVRRITLKEVIDNMAKPKDQRDPKLMPVCTTINNQTALHLYRGEMEDWTIDHCKD